MRMTNHFITVLAVVASVAASAPSAAFAQSGLGGVDSATPAGTPQVETATAATTRLYVKTLPPGAEVTLDGMPLGASDGLFLVPAGTGKVSVQFERGEPQVRQVEIVEGRITRVEITAGAGGDGAAALRRQAAPFREAPRLTSQRDRVDPKPLSGIDGVLKKPLEQPLQFVAAPLGDVIDSFRDAAGVDVLIDRYGLEEYGLSLDMPITAHVSGGLPLAVALDVVLREAGLTWIVRDDLLEVTTPQQARERLFVHIHDVSNLAETTDGIQLLVSLVRDAAAPHTWDTTGGLGSISPTGSAIAVSQSWRVQRQVAGFLDVLSRLKATPAEDRRPLGAGGYWSDHPAAVAARAALDKPLSADYSDAPLRDLLANLAEQADVPIALDTRALEDIGLDSDLPVTFTVSSKPLVIVLDRILEPLDLALDVRDEGLVVTTQEERDNTMNVTVYPVGHLGGGDRTVGSLVHMVYSMVTPFAWDSTGGLAIARPVDGDMPCLVVLHSAAGHRAVQAFLESLPPSRQPGPFAPTLEPDPTDTWKGGDSQGFGGGFGGFF